MPSQRQKRAAIDSLLKYLVSRDEEGSPYHGFGGADVVKMQASPEELGRFRDDLIGQMYADPMRSEVLGELGLEGAYGSGAVLSDPPAYPPPHIPEVEIGMPEVVGRHRPPPEYGAAAGPQIEIGTPEIRQAPMEVEGIEVQRGPLEVAGVEVQVPGDDIVKRRRSKGILAELREKINNP